MDKKGRKIQEIAGVT